MAEINDMSLDELKTFIENNQDSANLEDNIDINTDVDENTDEENTEEENTEDEDNTSGEDESTDENKEDPNIQGKTIEELSKIIADQKVWISKQGNQIGELRKKQQEEKRQAIKKKMEDLEYDGKDIEIVREVIRDEFEQVQTKKQQEAAELREQIFKDNQAVYTSIKSDPVIYNRIEPLLNEAYEKAGNTALYQEGWLQTQVGLAVKKIMSGSGKTNNDKGKTNKESVADRKKKATMNSSASNSSSGGVNVKKMNSADYLKHINSQLGVKDLRSSR